MIPTAIVAGFVLGMWLRWWTVPVVAVGWGVTVAFGNSANVFAGALLGGLNALVGVALAISLRRLLHIPKSAPFQRSVGDRTAVEGVNHQ
jgi:hypothetical protein